MQTNPVISSSAFATNNATFLPAPRIGLAWSPLGSKTTVVRAGFGTYYALLDNLSYRLDQNAPFNDVSAVKSIALATHFSDSDLYRLQSVIPSGVEPNLKTPTIESYSLKIEQQIAPNTTLGVGYIGSHGYHEIFRSTQTSQFQPFARPRPAPPAIPRELSSIRRTRLSQTTLSEFHHWISRGISSYNGLEVDMNHRLSHGLQFRGVYTYSKALDDGDSLNTSIATNSPAFVADPLRPMDDYGPGSFDISHVGVINATYDPPLAREAAANSWYNRIASNWQISGIETMLSGLPFTPQLSYNPSNDGDSRNPVRPSLNPSFTGPIIVGSPNEYFNPAAFIQPLNGTYGNVGRNLLRGPHQFETDFSLAKKILFTERLNLQFRSEFFNIFNHTNFNTPNPVVYTAATGGPSPTAGVITSTATTSRQVQFGLKLLW